MPPARKARRFVVRRCDDAHGLTWDVFDTATGRTVSNLDTRAEARRLAFLESQIAGSLASQGFTYTKSGSAPKA